MKKIILALFAFGTSIGAVSAQVEIGLKVSPSINYLRTDTPSNYGFKNEDALFGFGGGLVIDYFFGENYAFGTGLTLTSKGGRYSYFNNYQAINPNDPLIPARDEHKLSIQYLEVPLTLKLFTNEVAPDVRVYFQVGGSLAVPIGARLNDGKRYIDRNTQQETSALSHVFFLDANAIGGFGVEYQLGQSTKVFGGLSYHRGLVNLDSYFDDERSPKLKDVAIKNNVFALDLGLKF